MAGIPWWTAALLAPWVLGLGACSRDPGRPVPRRVVLISLDTLRADRLDCYGYERETAPNLAALAREGWRFDSVLAQAGQTLVSHKSLFHGRYPLELLGPAALPRSRAAVVASLRRLDGGLLEELRRGGWSTAAFTDGGWMRAEMGFDRGFDHFDEQGGGLLSIVPRVERWLRGAPQEPTFLFLHAYDVHCPYPTREPFDSRFCRDHAAHVPLEGRCALDDLEDLDLGPVDLAAVGDHYDASIASADAFLGELFAALRELDAWDESLVLVTSDHGELLGERGRVGHGALDPEELFVPLLVKFPASWRVPPRVVDEPLELIDVLPSVLQACGLPVPSGCSGRSFLPLLEGRDRRREVLVAETVFRDPEDGACDPGRRAAVLPGELHLAEGGARPAACLLRSAGRWEPVQDPPARVAELYARLGRRAGREPATADEPRPALSPELVEDLRALGYGGD